METKSRVKELYVYVRGCMTAYVYECFVVLVETLNLSFKTYGHLLQLAAHWTYIVVYSMLCLASCCVDVFT